ncbi:MAG: hypothetical protein COX77_02965 [Candidatus Komeilibacteria bacterium CG_4_10_14_0_2_um_filter_37_10]|uniref:DUF1648 domain-containing protein n=1 Tax=Candidatus Komeilibacteria bacterium CG_4_10_14_0_2_um_filter_37_10 TaxID=1974470 RepID=A0A2M7VEQ9_9BACT|nr:MAG: hypothetical protein COX77_02965 [Candidatus Komeilibacteria bacterium CG_4_10_14_0_2_um_filter_37_10]
MMTKFNIKKEWPAIILIALATVASLYFYQHFPERVPTHWNFAGEADGYSAKAFAAFFFPALIIVLYLLFNFLPKLDPKRDRYEEFVPVYLRFKLVLVAFFVILYFISSLVGIGYNLPINVVVPIMVGLLFIFIGNYLGKIKQNWFIGIRTPWTLANEEVWNKTHRVGGWAFIIAGVLFLITPLVANRWSIIAILILVGITIISVIVYSYILFKKISKKTP